MGIKEQNYSEVKSRRDAKFRVSTNVNLAFGENPRQQFALKD
jgi:hypothetical protein